MHKLYLLVSALGLAVIGLSYGVAPGSVLPEVLAVSVEGADLHHIFRAIMGLYLCLAAFWVVGAVRPAFTRAALLCEVVFMTGLAFGRLVSLLVDGRPSALLLLYLFLEVVFAALGVYLLRRMPSDTA